jgi:hypothetical protein
MPLWAKIAIPAGACAAIALAVVLPLTLHGNSNNDGKVFMEAGESMARLVKTNANVNSGLSKRHQIDETEGKFAASEGPSIIYYVGLLLNNGYDVVHQPMHFYSGYHFFGGATEYDLDYDLIVSADRNVDQNELTFYGHEKIRIKHDPANNTPFPMEADFVMDTNYDESTDTIQSFRFNTVGFGVKNTNDYYEYDGASYWKSSDSEESDIKAFFTEHFAILEERKTKAIDAKGGASIFSDASNHCAELLEIPDRMAPIVD